MGKEGQMRRILATATMTVVLVLAPGVSAHAGGAIEGCPDSYQLTHTFKDDPVDLSGQRWICERQLPSPDSKPGGQGTSLVIDNVWTQ
jgi:hypothetical protein